MKSRALLVSLVLCALLAPDATAQWQKGGTRIADVPFTVQWQPQIVVDGEGGAIICWQDDRNGTWDIYAQRVDSSGYLLWGADGLPVATGPATQDMPVMVSDDHGGAIIAWEQPAYSHVYAQRIDPEGERLWGEDGIVVCDASGIQYNIDIVEDGLAGAFLVWEDESGPGTDIYAQHVDSAGDVKWQEDGVLICGLSESQFYPHLVLEPSGGIIVGWQDGRDWAKVYVQKVDAEGNTFWVDNGVPTCEGCISGWLEDEFQLASDLNGGVYAIWVDYTDGSGDIYLGRVDRTGHLPWDPRGIPLVEHNLAVFKYPFVLTDSVGGAFCTYNVGWFNTPEWDSVFVQRVDSEGNKYWHTVGKGVSHPNGSRMSLVFLGDDEFGLIVSRPEFETQFAIKTNLNGEILWDTLGVNFVGEDIGSYRYRATRDGKGGMLVTWDNTWAYAQRIYPDGHAGGDTTTEVEDIVPADLPSRFVLLQNYPNPFNPTTTISFYLPEASPEVVLKVLNLCGQEVRRFNLGKVQKGPHRITWDGKDQKGIPVSSGIYFYSLASRSNTQVKKMILLK
jgi:hypothetical protein